MSYHLILLTTPIVRHCLTEGSRLRWRMPWASGEALRSSAEVADANRNAAKVHIAGRCPPTCAGAERKLRCPLIRSGILSEVKLSTEITTAVAGKTIWQIRIGTDSLATTGVLPQRFF